MSVSAPVEVFQSEWELGHLTQIYDNLYKSRYPHTMRALEIGAMYGGTLWHWMRPFASVVVIDDEMREAETWGQWAEDSEVDLTLLQGSSQDPALIAAARKRGPYDFLFIDGDHRYEQVRADWENYSPMAKVVAFHDILERPRYGVSVLWSQIKARPGTRWMEICQNETLPGNEGPCGIGIVWLD